MCVELPAECGQYDGRNSVGKVRAENMNITNEVVTRYLDGLYRALTPSLAELRQQAEKDRVPVILRDTERFLASVLTMVRPRRILEVGAAVGYSSSCFAEICGANTRITTLEADPDMYERASENIKRLGYGQQIEIVFGDAKETIKELKPVYDFVFIDAAKSHYRAFFDGALRLCRPGSVIVCDNVLMKAMTASDEYDTKGKYKTSIRRMREFLEYITESDAAETSVFAAGDGISLSVVKQDAEIQRG